jgi:hypothetical protein
MIWSWFPWCAETYDLVYVDGSTRQCRFLVSSVFSVTVTRVRKNCEKHLFKSKSVISVLSHFCPCVRPSLSVRMEQNSVLTKAQVRFWEYVASAPSPLMRTHWDCNRKELVIVPFNTFRDEVSKKSKSKLHYDRQLVGQSVLVSGAHLGPIFLSPWDFLLDSYCLLCCSALSGERTGL